MDLPNFLVVIMLLLLEFIFFFHSIPVVSEGRRTLPAENSALDPSHSFEAKPNFADKQDFGFETEEFGVRKLLGLLALKKEESP